LLLVSQMALFRRIKAPFVETAPEGEAGSPARPRSVADVLRERREELGLDLGECAAALNLKPTYLQALEEGRPERLPGPTYATGFIRAYAAYLSLDASAILRRFKSETGGFDTKPDLAVPVPLSERSMPGSGMLIVALILVICGYGAWYYLSTADRSRPERVSDVPASLLPPKPKPSAEASAPATAMQIAPLPASSEAKAAPEPPAAAAASAEAAPAELATITAPPPVTHAAAIAAPANTAAAEPATTAEKGDAAAIATAAARPPALPDQPKPAPPADAARTYGTTNGASRIVIRANADSWVQVSDGDHALFTRTLKAGDSYRVPDKPGITLRTGNAGGLAITVDGHPVPPIGQPGVLRHEVTLDPKALATGTAVHD
jgi:cytoskeletal protein RodZ